MIDNGVQSTVPSGARGPGRRDARDEILDDLRRVKPLAAPWKRAAWTMVPWAVVATALVWLGAGARPDLESLGAAAVFGVSVILLLAAVAVAWLLARMSVPGLYAPAGAALIGVTVLVASRVAVAALIDAWRPFPIEVDQGLRLALVCSGAVAALAIPWVVGLLVLARRGLLTRTLAPAILAGAAAVVAGDALWRLHCPFTSPVHIVAGHLTPIVVLIVAWLAIATRRLLARPGAGSRRSLSRITSGGRG